MRSEIAQVQHDLDVTTIYVTHDQTEAMTLGDRVAVMRAGVIQQVGSPEELYERPRNLFVAGFIGSPPMNMAVGRVVRDGDDLAVRLGSATIRLHPSVEKDRPALAAYVAHDVAVGIRSEDMEDPRLVRDAPADTKLLDKDAHTDEAPAHTEIQGTRFVAAFDPRSRVKAGDQVEVVIDTERMHFFDPETGGAIRD